MDDFGETDAAADFLARERETLGDMEAEIIADNVASGVALPTTTTTDQQMSSGEFEMIEKTDDFSSEIIGANENEDSLAGMHISSNIPQPSSTVREIPEKIRLWQENQKQMLEKKDRDEQEAIEKLRKEGKEELDSWYKNHQNSLEKTRAMRANDSAQMSDTNGSTESEDWKSIYQLIDFSKASTSKTNRDTSRMKNIFLQLKQNPLAREG